MDHLSHLTVSNHKWTLNDSIFTHIFHDWGELLIDVFATANNTKCSQYCSCARIGSDSIRDTFMIDWGNHLLHLFPPVPLIQRTVIRIRQFHADAILIVPLWPQLHISSRCPPLFSASPTSRTCFLKMTARFITQT